MGGSNFDGIVQGSRRFLRSVDLLLAAPLWGVALACPLIAAAAIGAPWSIVAFAAATVIGALILWALVGLATARLERRGDLLAERAWPFVQGHVIDLRTVVRFEREPCTSAWVWGFLFRRGEWPPLETVSVVTESGDDLQLVSTFGSRRQIRRLVERLNAELSSGVA